MNRMMEENEKLRKALRATAKASSAAEVGLIVDAALSQQADPAPAQDEQQPVAWGAFHFGGRRSGRLYTHCETEQQIESYIADLHRSNDSITLRKGPLYAAPIAQTALQSEFGDAYQGTREDLAIWKRLALEAEQKVRQQEQIIDHLTLEAQGETRMGEPVIPQTAPQPEQSGLVLMPKEATPEIVAAMKRELDKAATWYCRYSAAYRAALSAQGTKP